MSTKLDQLCDKVIDVVDEDYDKLLYYYPTVATTDRDDMPEVRLRFNGDLFKGIVLGYGTSFEEAHMDHIPGGRPAPGDRCSGCRWTDVTIMWAQPYNHDDGPTAPWQYCVIIRGRSILAGEDQRVRTTWTPDAAMVLDTLHVPVPRRLRITGRERSVSGPHEDALLDAACIDDELNHVAEAFKRERASTR